MHTLTFTNSHFESIFLNRKILLSHQPRRGRGVSKPNQVNTGESSESLQYWKASYLKPRLVSGWLLKALLLW